MSLIRAASQCLRLAASASSPASRHPISLLLSSRRTLLNTTNGFECLDSYSINLIQYKTRRLIGQVGYTDSDRDDIEQELALHLHQYLPKHDPARGTIKTFVNCVLDNKIRTMVSARLTSLYDVRMHGSSLDEYVQTESDDCVCTGDIIDEEDYLMRTGNLSRPVLEVVELQIDVRRVVSELPADLRDLCEHLVRKNITEISREAGVSRQKIYEMRNALRFIFSQDGLDEYA